MADEFLTYGSALSAGRRWIVFKRFYPRFAAPEPRSDVVLLYDLGRSAAENRVPAARSAPTAENAGLPIFPVANATETIVAPQPRDTISVLRPFAWAPDDSRVAFLARGDESGYLAVVATIGAETIDVCARALEEAEYLEGDASTAGAKPLRLNPERLALGASGELQVRPYDVRGIRKELRLDILGRCDEHLTIPTKR